MARAVLPPSPTATSRSHLQQSITNYVGLLRTINESRLLTAPTSEGVSGDGGQDRGRALWDENRPRLYTGLDFKNIKYLLTILRLWVMGDVALQPGNVSSCFLLPKDHQISEPLFVQPNYESYFGLPCTADRHGCRTLSDSARLQTPGIFS